MDPRPPLVPPALPPAHAPLVAYVFRCPTPRDTPQPPGQMSHLPAGPACCWPESRTDSTPCLHHGHMGLPPLVHPGTQHPCTHMHTAQRAPHPGKSLDMEFSEKPGQTVLVRCRHARQACMPDRRPSQCLFAQDWLLFFPSPSVFPRSFVPKPPQSIPFPTFITSPKQPIVSPVQS